MQTFKIVFTEVSEKQLHALESAKDRKVIYKSVQKTLGLMEVNLRHPSLNTHEYSVLSREYGCKVFESYAQNNTPQAYRIFWCYGPQKNQITIISIDPHPK